MRIVYSKENSAVIVAAEYPGGVNPSAVQIYPAYNPVVHGDFVLPISSLPSEFGAGRNPEGYAVDDIVSPTTVVVKPHFEVLPGSYSAPADGNTAIVLTVNVKTSANTLLTTGSYTAKISASAGVLSSQTVTTSGGTATLTLYSSREATSIFISASENIPVNSVPFVTPSLGTSIALSPTGLVPSSPDLYPGLVGKPYIKSSCWLNFFNAQAHAVGISKSETGSASNLSNDFGIFTQYDTAASASDACKVYTPFVITKKRQSFSASFVFMLGDLTESTKWIGLSAGDLSSKLAADLGTTFGFALAALIFEQGEIGSGDMAFAFDSGTASGAIYVVPSLVPTSDNSVYRLDVQSLGAGAGITMSLTIIAGDNVGKTQSWTTTAAWTPQDDTLMGMFASVRTKESVTKGFPIKSMYLEQA